MRQAIVTKYIPCTNSKGSRVKAWCDRGSVVISYPHGSNEPHTEAARALIAKFLKEDEARGTPKDKNPWNRPLIAGGLPDKGVNAYAVFVFEDVGGTNP